MLVNLSGEAVGPADNAAGNHHNNNNGNSNGNGRAPFMRGDKSSASVRLRTKKSEIVAGNPGNGKKRNRHSGDFSFFSSKSSSEQQQQQQSNAASVSPTRGTTEVKKGGDWAYITFPNGVPTVQDIKTNVGPVSQREAVLPIPMRGPPNPGAAAMLMPGSRASVHLPQGMINKRMSTDFSSSQQFVSLDNHNNPSPDVQPRHVSNGGGGGVVMRQRPPQQQQQQQQQVHRNSCYIEQTPKHVTQVTVTSSPHESPHVKRPLSTAAANVLFRRKQQSPSGPTPGAAHPGGVAKRCSGEFDFVRHNRRASLVLLDTPEGVENTDVVRVRVRDGSHPSPDLVVNRAPDPALKSENRLPGLGRRAVTQINIRHGKKNSYNAAICKSQENLVKVGNKFLS